MSQQEQKPEEPETAGTSIDEFIPDTPEVIEALERQDADIAMAKLKATEMLAMVSDEAIQIHGGMGLMDELPLERIWRDARIERIWDGTSEIQRHIISRSLLRPLGG